MRNDEHDNSRQGRTTRREIMIMTIFDKDVTVMAMNRMVKDDDDKMIKDELCRRTMTIMVDTNIK